MGGKESGCFSGPACWEHSQLGSGGDRLLLLWRFIKILHSQIWGGGGQRPPRALVTLRLWEQAGRILPTGKTSENPDLKSRCGRGVCGYSGARTQPLLPPDPLLGAAFPLRFTRVSSVPSRKRTSGSQMDRIRPAVPRSTPSSGSTSSSPAAKTTEMTPPPR